MKVVVDFEVCASTGACMPVCPAGFEVRAEGLLDILMDAPTKPLPDKVREAADLCPTATISLEE